MRKSPLVLVILSLFLLIGLSSSSQAQCITCAGGHCVYVTSGHGSCVEYPDPDISCKLACPNCPTAPCDPGGGGGGGGGCAVFDPMDALGSVAPNKTVVTSGLLFRSDAATNAKVFGGRGQGVRVLPGGAFGDLTADGAARAIEDLSPQAAGRLTLSHGFTNVNNAGIPVSFTTPDGEGFGFAPSTGVVGAEVRVKVRGMTKLARAVGNVGLSTQDLLLVDVSIHGKAYILALKSEVLDSSAPDSQARLRTIEDSLRNSYQMFPTIERIPIETC